VQHQYAPTRRYRVEWLTFDNKAGKPSGTLESTGLGQIPAAAANAPLGSYVMAHITAEGATPGMAVNVTCVVSRMDFASPASTVNGPVVHSSIRASSFDRSATGMSNSTPTGSESSTPTRAR
jgi:hypothetical protein